MARPYWSGRIQISLVGFGVKLFPATEVRADIRFHQIDRSTGERVRHQKVLASSVERAPDEAADPVEASRIVKGYEYSKGHYVTLEPDELAHLRVPAKHTMEVTQFVDLDAIDPAYFEKPYFVVPEDDAQTEAYLTVRQALVDTHKLALTTIAFSGREHVVALAPTGHRPNGKSGHSKAGHAGSDAPAGMMAYTLRYAAELRDPAEYFRDIARPTLAQDSLELAKELIQRKSAPFDPARFVDGYETAVKQLVEAKLQHAPIPRDEAPAPTRGKVIDLMDALRRSVAGDAKPAAKAGAKAVAHRPSTHKTTAKGPTLVRPAATNARKPVRSATAPRSGHAGTATAGARSTPQRKSA